MNFQELMQRMVDLDRPVAETSTDVVDLGVDECGEMMPPMPNGMMGDRNPGQQDSVNMNVSLNAAGAGGIKDLMDILRNIEEKGEEEMPGFGDADADVIIKRMGHELEDDFANEPDETYGNIDSVTQTGGDLHSKGIEAPAANGGGNPMGLKARLESLYQEIKNR